MDSIDSALSAPCPSTIHRRPSAHTELRRSDIFSHRSREIIPRLPIPYHRPTWFLHSDTAHRKSFPAARLPSLGPAHRLPFPRATTSLHTREGGHRFSKSDNRGPSLPRNVPPNLQLRSIRFCIRAAPEVFHRQNTRRDSCRRPSRNQPFRSAANASPYDRDRRRLGDRDDPARDAA